MKIIHVFFAALFFLNVGCEDESSSDVELWGKCYSIADTDSLNLSIQQLTGTIPPDLGKLTNLTFLSLATNQLTGPIPKEIGNLVNMTHLQLWYNQFTGEIPHEIWNLNNLEGLGLASNQLKGEIPLT